MGWFEDLSKWADETIADPLYDLYDNVSGATPYKIQAQGALDSAKTEADAATLGAETAAKAAEKAAEKAALAEEEAARIGSKAAQDAADARVAAAKEAARVYAEAVDRATAAQTKYADLAIEEKKKNFAETEKRLNPWVQSGTDALGRQRALLGLDGADSQRQFIEGVSGSPEFMSLVGQGENALLQQGAATGGLRGGNTAAALAQFRPSMLSELINRQYERFAGMSSEGKDAATTISGFGDSSSSKIADLLTYKGDAIGQGEYSKGEAYSEREKAIGEALAQGKISVAEAEALGLRNAAAYRSKGTADAGLYRGQGITNAGKATAEGQYAAAQANAGANNARWAPIRGGIKDVWDLGMNYLGGGGGGGGTVPAGGSSQSTAGSF